MKKNLGMSVFVLLSLGLSYQAAWCQPVVDYQVNARLDTANKKVVGEERLTWLNTSNAAVSSVPFHLYLNAFRNNRSTFMKESGLARRPVRWENQEWGLCRVNSIQVEGGADLTPSLRFIQPDDGNPDDRTVVEVSLPQPVEPGREVTFLIRFESKLPRVVARSGYHDEFYMVSQWFPKVGVLEDGGWNCHQYHAYSEFFADFGRYRVAITVPDGYVVGATGKRVGEEKNAGGTRTYVHEQDNIHDFAWAACPDFVEFREKFSLDSPRVETEMILLIHREHLKLKDRHLRALKFALEFYSRNYGPYPYPTITLVDPAPGAMAAGGMEYPTLFTTMSHAWFPAGVHLPELVTIHEFGHNYWYGMIGSNEFEEAWLDEGFNTYSEIKAVEQLFGREGSVIDWLGLRVSSLDEHRMQVIASGRMDPVVRASWEFFSGGSYGLNVYSKAGLSLLMLEKMLGQGVMARVMKTYFERWRYEHPATADFIAVAEEVSGRELRWFFDRFFFSPDKLDYALGALNANPVADFEGLDDKGEVTSPGPSGNSLKPKLYRSEVVIVRQGELVFPQVVEVVFEDGLKLRERWDGQERWKRFVYFKAARVKSARLDPEGLMILDTNRANNSRSLKPHTRLSLKAGLGLMTVVQRLLGLLGF